MKINDVIQFCHDLKLAQPTDGAFYVWCHETGSERTTVAGDINASDALNIVLSLCDKFGPDFFLAVVQSYDPKMDFEMTDYPERADEFPEIIEE